MLKFTRSDYDAIRRHGEETYPHECCGVLLGHFEEDGARIVTSKSLIRRDIWWIFTGDRKSGVPARSGDSSPDVGKAVSDTGLVENYVPRLHCFRAPACARRALDWKSVYLQRRIFH